MKAARAAMLLARFSVLQMFEAIRDAMPAGDMKMTAVTCRQQLYSLLTLVFDWMLILTWSLTLQA